MMCMAPQWDSAVFERHCMQWRAMLCSLTHRQQQCRPQLPLMLVACLQLPLEQSAAYWVYLDACPNSRRLLLLLLLLRVGVRSTRLTALMTESAKTLPAITTTR